MRLQALLPRSFRHAALLFSLASCGVPRPSLPREEAVQDEGGVLVPTDRLGTPAFSVVQRVRGTQGRASVAFECVVRLQRGKLSVAGTTLHSTHAFAVEQEGVRVSAHSATLRDVPFEPVNVLYDIHRVFFRGLAPAQSDGWHERIEDDELVRELWRDGRLASRTFHALDTYAKLVVIEFDGAPAPVVAPRVRLTNLRYSYSLDIEHIRQERLVEGYSLDVERGGPQSAL